MTDLREAKEVPLFACANSEDWSQQESRINICNYNNKNTSFKRWLPSLKSAFQGDLFEYKHLHFGIIRAYCSKYC